MIKGEDVRKTSDITLGTNYEINKNLVEKYEKPLTEEELKEKATLISNFIIEKENFYLMLLCHEQRDYTLFNLNGILGDLEAQKTVQELYECLKNRGVIKGIDETLDHQAIEIWLSIEGESYVYYFFGYDNGVIEIGGNYGK